ncbi:MAG: hypothetical protein A2Y77_08210 [Planctomycetes bacterium RBG_13_62_9]|nr:MAG: hypothetical protein A2Y77_08210 [Planctomycetes bacterium RBG_13_62_9]
MIVNTPTRLQEFYRRLMAEENLSHEESLRIYDALHEEALALGAISSENVWDGFEVDLRIAKAMRELERARKADTTNS